LVIELRSDAGTVAVLVRLDGFDIRVRYPTEEGGVTATNRDVT
jgi:hypothetical protein